MLSLPSGLFSSSEIISNSSDVTACVFLLVLVIAALIQKRSMDIYRFMSGLLLMIAGLCCRISGRALYYVQHLDGMNDQAPEVDPKPAEDGLLESVRQFIENITAPENVPIVVMILAFIFIYCSVSQIFWYLTNFEKRNHKGKSGFTRRLIITNIIIAAAGIIIYIFTNQYDVLTAAMMAKCCLEFYNVKRDPHFAFRKGPFIVVLIFCFILCLLGIIVQELKYTGIAFTSLYLILYIEIQLYVERELSDTKAELAESRFRLLNEQISSHYVFNSLKVIEDMCEADPGRAKQMINAFSKYLRSNLEGITGDSMIPFEEEMEHTRQYIALEQIKGTSAFDITYDLKITEFTVPPISLQPLVENAIKHGVRTFGADIVSISTSKEEDGVYITVCDNGKAVQLSGSTHRSVALDNIKHRLREQCGGTLTVEHSEKGTKAVIRIPI